MLRRQRVCPHPAGRTSICNLQGICSQREVQGRQEGAVKELNPSRGRKPVRHYCLNEQFPHSLRPHARYLRYARMYANLGDLVRRTSCASPTTTVTHIYLQ